MLRSLAIHLAYALLGGCNLVAVFYAGALIARREWVVAGYIAAFVVGIGATAIGAWLLIAYLIEGRIH